MKLNYIKSNDMLLAIESVRKYKEIFLETNEKISTTKMEGILRDETHSYIDLYHIKKMKIQVKI